MHCYIYNVPSLNGLVSLHCSCVGHLVSQPTPGP